MDKKLEEKIEQVYNYIVSFITENGYSPTVRDICANLKIKSTASAYSYISVLKERGLLENSPLKKRTITLPNRKVNDIKKAPLVGTIRAGEPIFAENNIDGYIPLPQCFSADNNYFALKVQGNSMVNAGINNDDIIIVYQQNDAVEGDIVVALIDDSATVKRFFRRDNKIILHPENDEMSDLVYDNVSILGVVKGLFRKF